jgi:hypothetical protein
MVEKVFPELKKRFEDAGMTLNRVEEVEEGLALEQNAEWLN